MPIPAEILAVPRPEDTIVVCDGKNKDHYAVRQRVGCKRADGKPKPVNGPIIGHIVDGQYVPIAPEQILGKSTSDIDTSPVAIKRWADIQLCSEVGKSLYEELLAVYNPEDAARIMCLAILQVCNPGLRDDQLADAYEESFLTDLYPDVNLEFKSILKFRRDLGKAYQQLQAFKNLNASKFNASKCVLIDGFLKSNESKENTLPEFTRKFRTEKNLSVAYAFDIDQGEPIYCDFFFMGTPDLSFYNAVALEYGFSNAIWIREGKAEGLIDIQAAAEERKKYPSLHFLTPLERDSWIVQRYQTYAYDGWLKHFKKILFKKDKLPDGRYLYSFRDLEKAEREESDWMDNAFRTKTYSSEAFHEVIDLFGTLWFETDLDLEPEQVYKLKVWQTKIGTVLNSYQSSLGFDDRRMPDDFSVYGGELIDFVSSVLTFRLLHLFTKKKILNFNTYQEVMTSLAKAQKASINNGEWQLVKIGKRQQELLQKLGLLDVRTAPAARKRGRPRKNSDGGSSK